MRERVYSMAPRAWGAVYRDHLSARTGEVSEDQAISHFEDIATEVLTAEGYPTVWKGIFISVFEICECDGDAVWETHEGKASGTWTLRWWPKAPSDQAQPEDADLASH